MSPARPEYVLLFDTDSSELVPIVETALKHGRVPYRIGVLPGPPARAVFSVRRDRLATARELLAVTLPVSEADEDEEWREATEPAPAVFPWRPVLTVLALIVFHAGLVLGLASPLADRAQALHLGGVLSGATATEPWRLITAMFLHSGLSHVMWNGVSMMVFAVPLLQELGRRRTWLIYLAAGVAGGVAAATFGQPGTLTVGSSGAVAGLFGVWVIRRLQLARSGLLGKRARLKALGVGLLVLPSLISPTGSAGQSISVSSHLGGLVAGLLLGLFAERISFPERPRTA